MVKLKKVDPTNGPILSSILKYAFPVFLTSIIQTFMNATDTAVVGNMADSTAVASVGATGTIVALLVQSMLGISEGAKILLARSIGAGDYERCKRIVSTAIISAFSLGILVAIAGSVLSKPILLLMDCPDDCLDGAVTYLSIYFISTPLTLIYNFCAGIMAVSGDSAKPMKYMLISGISNVMLNVLFCLVLPNKVTAVAIATVVGTAISTTLAMRDVIRHDRFAFDVKHITFNLHEFLLMFKYGIPLSLNSALYPIANLQIQSTINGFGSAAIAGNTSAIYIESIVCGVHAGAGSASSTFVGQNLGARKPERVKTSLLTCTLISCGITLPLSLSLLTLGSPLLSIFLPGDTLAIAHGMTRLKYHLSFYFIPGITCCINAALNAFGYTFIPSASSIFSVLVFRVIWMNLIYPLWPVPDMLYICFVVSWAINLLICSSAFFIIYFTKFKKDKLKAL